MGARYAPVTRENMVSQHDNELIKRCLVAIKQGDRQAVEELHACIGNHIRFIALKYAPTDWDADDLVQDFWLHIDDYAASYQLGSGYAYLAKCFNNYCLRWAHNRSVEPKTVSVEMVDLYEERLDEDATVRQLAVKELFAKAAATMTPEERLVYALSVHEGKSIRAIAADLGRSKSEVGRLHKSAMDKLAKVIRESGWEV